MRSEPLDDTDPIGPLADEVEAGHGPVALVRPGHQPVVLISAEHWAHLLELESDAGASMFEDARNGGSPDRRRR